MTTFYITTSSNKEITPSWITGEHYYNCEKFEEDYKSNNSSLIKMIQKLFRK